MLYLAMLQAWLFFNTYKAMFLNMINDPALYSIRYAHSFAMLLLGLYHELPVNSVINLTFIEVASFTHMKLIILVCLISFPQVKKSS